MKLPYVGITLALIVLGIVIAKFNLPHIPEAEGGHAVTHDSLWGHRNLVMGAVAIFAYVGAEVSIGSFLVKYMNLPFIGNLRPESRPSTDVLLGGARSGDSSARRCCRRSAPAWCWLVTQSLPLCWSACPC